MGIICDFEGEKPYHDALTLVLNVGGKRKYAMF
jgi:hypothetical protein